MNKKVMKEINEIGDEKIKQGKKIILISFVILFLGIAVSVFNIFGVAIIGFAFILMIGGLMVFNTKRAMLKAIKKGKKN